MPNTPKTQKLIDAIKLDLETTKLSTQQIAYKHFVSGHFVDEVVKGRAEEQING